MNTKTTFLFVDGSNLYASQYQLFGPKYFLNFRKFIKNIEMYQKIKFNKIFFYASYSSPKTGSKTEKNYLKKEFFFYKSAIKTPHCTFFKGYRSPTSGKEKEVDVKLAVDIVDKAHQKQYKSLYLISGDADFMHALVIVQNLKIEINIISTENRVPHRFVHIYKTICVITKKGYKVPYHNKITPLFTYI